MEPMVLGQQLLALRGGDGDAALLGARLVALWEEGRAAWPGVDLAAPRLVEAVARGAGERSAAESADGVRAADLYLATACAEGSAAALAAFERTLLSKVRAFLAGMRATDELVEATQQALREKLFVGTARTPPKITQYSGRGSLEGWVRVAAARTALNLMDGARETASDDATLVEQALPAGTNVELDHLKARYRVDVAAALREALAALDAQDRTLLRFRYVDGLLPGQIAGLYGLHRTTVLRRIDAAVAALLLDVRRRVAARLKLGAREADSLLQLVRSQLDLTLGGLIREESP
jgi:RNA polymerase sigma-70 factor (ECF subfamily)